MPTSSHFLKIHFNIILRTRGLVRFFITFLSFYYEELLVHLPNSKLEDHFSSAVRDCLFNVFAANLHFWRPFFQPQLEGARHAVATGREEL
jgi:hypothetical protein